MIHYKNLRDMMTIIPEDVPGEGLDEGFDAPRIAKGTYDHTYQKAPKYSCFGNKRTKTMFLQCVKTKMSSEKGIET